MAPAVVDRVVADVARDLADGAWDKRYGHLRSLDSFDAGMRMLVARPTPSPDELVQTMGAPD
jgi:hypothetical protein